MKGKLQFYIQEFKKAPLLMQNVIIKKSIYCIVYIAAAAIMLKAVASMNISIPGILVFGYLIFDFLRTIHVCCYEKYSLVSGQCIQIVEKHQLIGFKARVKIDCIRVRYEQESDILIRIRNQREVVDVEEEKMVDIYIPDLARIYYNGQGMKIKEYYCMLVRNEEI